MKNTFLFLHRYGIPLLVASVSLGLINPLPAQTHTSFFQKESGALGIGIFSVDSLVPAPNAASVSQSTYISVRFSEDVDTTSLSNATVRIYGSLSGPHKSSFDYDSTAKTLTIGPTLPFTVGDVVTVTLTRGIKSAAGDSLAQSYGWCFWIKNGVNSGVFRQASSTPVGINPFITTVADLDGDGSLDAVAVNNNSNSLSLLKNDGGGGFTLYATLQVGSYPCDVVAADFNNDGAVDLAVANGQSYSVSVFRNDGQANFTFDTTYYLGTPIWKLAIADFDGDGAIDLAATGSVSNSAIILENRGNGKFFPPSSVSVGGLPIFILAGDFDNNGTIDLAVLNHDSNSVSILKNNGKGVFTAYSTVSVGISPWMMTAGDFGGSGSIDLAVTNGPSNTISLLKNNGTGLFTLQKTLGAGVFPVGIAAADVNGDGHLDVVYGSASDSIVGIWMNDGFGNFNLSDSVIIKGGVARAIAPADVNNRGFLGLVVTDNRNNAVAVLKTQADSVPNPINHRPKANAGPDTIIKVVSDSLAQVILNGSGSWDPDGDSLTYVWKEDTTVLGTTVQPKVTLSLGRHIISLTVGDNKGGFSTDTVVVTIVAVPPFAILSIADVLNDQGKQVQIIWRTFEKDTSQPFVAVNYNVWRNDNNVWTHLAQIPSRKDSLLSAVVPTLYDSTISHGMHWSIFQVTVHGSDPSQIEYTPIDSGYSVDNLPPSILSGIAASVRGNAIVISWTPPADKDIWDYAVYRDTTSGFNPKGMKPYRIVSSPSFSDTAVQHHRTYYYRVSGIDSAGNESPYTAEISASIETGVGRSDGSPTKFELCQNYPNPFNPSTEITYSVPSEQFVTLKVYDMLGREVAVLVNGRRSAGVYRVLFEANALSSGVYLYQLRAGTMVQIKRMLLLK